MSFAIETDLGRFEAETEREAKKLLRAAQKKQAEKDARANELYKIARVRAQAEGYSILARHASGMAMPQGWRIKAVSTEYDSVRQFWDNERNERGYRIETADGSANVYPYYAITHYLENDAGYCMAIAIEGQDCELFAVGIAEDTCAWVTLDGIKASQFKQVIR